MKTPQLLSLGLIALSSFASVASAHEGGNAPMNHGPADDVKPLPGVMGNPPEQMEGPCSKLNLDADQKAKLKDLFFKFKETQIDLKAKEEKAHLAHMKVMTNPDSSFKDAESASKEMIDASTNLMRAREDYKNEIAFKILKSEQRQPAMACEMMMMHHGEHPGLDHKKPGEGPQNLPSAPGKTGKAPAPEQDAGPDANPQPE